MIFTPQNRHKMCQSQKTDKISQKKMSALTSTDILNFYYRDNYCCVAGACSVAAGAAGRFSTGAGATESS